MKLSRRKGFGEVSATASSSIAITMSSTLGYMLREYYRVIRLGNSEFRAKCKICRKKTDGMFDWGRISLPLRA